MDDLVEFILGSGNYVFNSETLVRIFCVALFIEFVAMVGRAFNRQW